MTEQTFIDLGFERIDVAAESEDLNEDFYYWTLDIGDINLISNPSDLAVSEGWSCEFYDFQTMTIRGAGDLEELVKILKLNTHD